MDDVRLDTDGTLWAYPADGCGSELCTQPLWQSTHLSQIIDSPAVANGVEQLVGKDAWLAVSREDAAHVYDLSGSHRSRADAFG